VAGLHRGAVALTGASATVRAVCAAMDGSRLAHIAAHGEVDPENPMFSALRLADGPLMTYDLERLRCPPTTVLLSACDSLSVTASGDELLSMALALLHLGSRTVLGSVAPLPDRAARPLMRELHRQMAAGAPPATALHRTQLAACDAEPDVAAAWSCLLCVGAG
jgi:CHAT domain-containing protein